MKIIRYERSGSQVYGVLEGDSVRAIQGSVYGDFKVGDEVCKLDQVRLLAPTQPRCVVGIGINYPLGAAGNQTQVPSQPVVFLKPASSVIGHLEEIVYPDMTHNVILEGELAVVMKCRAVRVDERDASRYILGYTCANDVTARDLMNPMSSTLGKGMYTFCPLGPCIETKLDENNARITASLNGVLKQQVVTSQMIYNVSRIISYVSGFMALEPGDVIITGAGGMLEDRHVSIQRGDEVEVAIDGIGILRNRVV